MWPQFTHLLWRIIHGMPVLVSSNWASWLILIGTFFLTEGFLVGRAKYEGEDMKQWWANRWNNLALGLLVTTIVYMSLFLWSTIQTVYDDHQDNIGRLKYIKHERDELKAGLQTRDSYIMQLKRANTDCQKIPSTPTTRIAEPERFGEPRVFSKQIPSNRKGLIGTDVTIQVDHTTQPTALRIHCTADIDAGDGTPDTMIMPFVGNPTVTGPQSSGSEVRGHDVVIRITSPAVKPETPIGVALYSKIPMSCNKAEYLPQ